MSYLHFVQSAYAVYEVYNCIGGGPEKGRLMYAELSAYAPGDTGRSGLVSLCGLRVATACSSVLRSWCCRCMAYRTISSVASSFVAVAWRTELDDFSSVAGSFAAVAGSVAVVAWRTVL